MSNILIYALIGGVGRVAVACDGCMLDVRPYRIVLGIVHVSYRIVSYHIVYLLAIRAQKQKCNAIVNHEACLPASNSLAVRRDIKDAIVVAHVT